MTTPHITEASLQAACFQWHWNTKPQERGQLFHVNNKARNAIEGNRMKAVGVVKGVSDFVLLRESGKVVFIELKTELGSQSPEQKKFQELAEKLGFAYRIIRTLEEFKMLINGK